MFKFGSTFQDSGYLELREEDDGYLLCVGDCFDDGEEEACMPLFCFSKRVKKKDIETLIVYLQEKIRGSQAFFKISPL